MRLALHERIPGSRLDVLATVLFHSDSTLEVEQGKPFSVKYFGILGGGAPKQEVLNLHVFFPPKSSFAHSASVHDSAVLWGTVAGNILKIETWKPICQVEVCGC